MWAHCLLWQWQKYAEDYNFISLLEISVVHFFNMNLIPTFETKRLFMRGVQLEDAESYEKNFVDYEIIKYLSPLVPWPYPKGGIKVFLQENVLPNQGKTIWFWVLFLKNKRDEVIGGLDLRLKANPGNRGFWLAQKHWGKGLMSEAIIPTTDYAFDELGLEKLILINATDNLPSRRIKEKIGATYLGSYPDKFVSTDYTEAEKWELAKETWRKFRGTSHS